ncbi:DUF6221 family protein [Kitasatospora sp. NPDC002227]|uniref:DUF6221 family protein n=1 Tax=Kitasatospora sp. NPDC002227 TaxID=3154773 RepID=UPI0033179490
MNDDLIRFLRAELDEDLHRVVMISSCAPPGTDVHLESTVPMIDMARAVTDLYASVASAEPTTGDFRAGWAAALEAAVRLLAQTYDDTPGYREQWRPQPSPRAETRPDS